MHRDIPDEYNYDVIFPIARIDYTTKYSIESAINQTYKYNKFIVIIDTCDEDMIDKIMSFFTEIKRCEIYYTRNKGPAKARNFGIFNSKAEYIALLDSDDVWHKNKIMLQMKSLQNNNYDFSITSYIATKFDLTSGIFLVSYNKRPSLKIVKYLNFIGNSTVLCKRELLISIGGYIDIPSKNDLATWIKLSNKNSIKLDYINEPLCLIAKNKGSVSSNKSIKAIIKAHSINHKRYIAFINSLIFIVLLPYVRLCRMIRFKIVIGKNYKQILKTFI